MTKGRDADFPIVTSDRGPFTHEEKQVDGAPSTVARRVRLRCCASGDIVTRGSLSVTPGTAGSWKP
jgi:hypothetical protein